MSRERVISWRARALYNIFWQKLPENPQWLKDILRDNPDIFMLLIECLTCEEGNLRFTDFKQRISTIARSEAVDRAITQVDEGSMSIERIQKSIENQ